MRPRSSARRRPSRSSTSFAWRSPPSPPAPKARRGEAGPFVEAGNTKLGGKLPVNTDGGACNVGRRHGANFCIEATRHLRGTSGQRQVDGADVADVAVWTNAVGPFSGAAFMTAE